MKIVYLSPSGGLGGAERMLLNMLTSLRRLEEQIDTHVVMLSNGPLGDALREIDVNVTEHPMPLQLARLGDSWLRHGSQARNSLGMLGSFLQAGVACPSYVRQLRRLIVGMQPDLIHSNGIKGHLFCRLMRLQYPAVWHLHDFCGTRPLVVRALRWSAMAARATIAVSEAVARDASAVLPGVPSHTIYNAIDTERFSPRNGDGNALDELACLPPTQPDCIRVGLVATYARWKGQAVFLEAAQRITATFPNQRIRFYIVGSPIYDTHGSQFSYNELRRIADACDIADRVGFVSFQRNVEDVYRALDIVVHASTQPEPFGLTIAEAMACGRPVVVSQAGGAMELFTSGYDAIGYQCGDAREMSHAIERLIEEPYLRDVLSKNARQSAVSKFSMARLASQLSGVYAKYISNKSHQAA